MSTRKLENTLFFPVSVSMKQLGLTNIVTCSFHKPQLTLKIIISKFKLSM
jgi:hypothetical protein